MASVDGEAGVLKAPAAEIRGATVHDQKWIDGTIEAGVQGLGWPRPGPRPAWWDAPAPPRPTVKPRPARTATEAIDRAAPITKPRPRWLRMLRPNREAES